MIRAIIDGKEVFGWYCLAEGRHFLVLEDAVVCDVGDGVIDVDVIEIDPATAAITTGRKDKHGKLIFGSKGEMQGGDRVQLTDCPIREVYFDTKNLQWALMADRGCVPLGVWESHELEIIPKSEGEQK